MAYRILVADDEAEIREVLRLYLEKEGYEIVEAADGTEAVRLVKEEKIDLALLDIMMPGMDGYRVLRNIREENNLPVIMLSAKSSDSDKILGLDLGADDYITKPFVPLEAVARVKSNLRRFYALGAGESRNVPDAVLQVGNLRLEPDSCLLYQDGERIELTSVEFRIMKLFMENPGRVFTKRQIFEAGWEETYMVSDNNVMVCISKLRAKLEKDGRDYIRTIRGLGYRLEKE
ncbi:MAG: response regulator transcription factor [Lachnospiraceae bacterium]|nr:response regulator transcription factor [Lachnospiraceae bacterium]